MENDRGKAVLKESLEEAPIHATDLPQDMASVSNEQAQLHGSTNVVQAVPANPHVELPDAYIDPHITLNKEEFSGIQSSGQHSSGIGSSKQPQIEGSTFIRHENPFPEYEFTPEEQQELSRILEGLKGGSEQVTPGFVYGVIPGPRVRAEDIFVEPTKDNTVPRVPLSESDPEESSSEPEPDEHEDEEWDPTKGKKRKSSGKAKSKSGKKKYPKGAKKE